MENNKEDFEKCYKKFADFIMEMNDQYGVKITVDCLAAIIISISANQQEPSLAAFQFISNLTDVMANTPQRFGLKRPTNDQRKT